MKRLQKSIEKRAAILLPKIEALADLIKEPIAGQGRTILKEIADLSLYHWNLLIKGRLIENPDRSISNPAYKWIGAKPTKELAIALCSGPEYFSDYLNKLKAEEPIAEQIQSKTEKADILPSIRKFSIQEKGMLKVLEQLHGYLETTKKTTSIDIQLITGINPEHWNKLVKGGIIVAVDNGTKGWKWAGIKPNIHMAIETLKESGKFENLDNHLPFEPPTGKRFFKNKTKVTILTKLLNSAYEEKIEDDEISAILLVHVSHIKNLRLNIDCPYEVWERIRLWYSTGLLLREFKISANDQTPYVKPAVSKISKQKESEPEAGILNPEQSNEENKLSENNSAANTFFTPEQLTERFIKERKGLLLLVNHGTHQTFDFAFDADAEQLEKIFKENHQFKDAETILICSATLKFYAQREYKIGAFDENGKAIKI